MQHRSGPLPGKKPAFDFLAGILTFTGMKVAEEKWERLVDLACLLHEQNDFHEILRVTAQQAASLLRGETALLLMINPRTRETVKTVMREGCANDDRRFKTAQNQLSGWIMQQQQPLLSEDITQDARFSRTAWGEVAIKSVIGVPLRSEGALIGTLILLNKISHAGFNEDDLAYLDKFAVIAAPYLRNVQKIAEYFNTPLPETALVTKYEQAGLLGKCSRFVELLQAVEAAARCEVRVLLEGQTGTGKELVARAIHQFGRRHNHPFIAIDCGAIPANLIESELFGHVKGAFTGAMHDRKGLFGEANGGTLFMDEIANLPLEMQAKLMRVLVQNELRPLGGNKTHKIDVRIISASSHALRELVEKGQFREDLYYRLHVYPIAVPALAERREDVPLLANHFLKKFARQQQKQAELFHARLLEGFKYLRWEGNVRQLENVVERLVTLVAPDTKVLDEKILPADLKKQLKQTAVVTALNDDLALPEHLAVYETQLIRQALEANAWSQSQAARQLRIPVQTLHYKMKKLGINKSSRQMKS